ncbi:acyl-CoA desaturase [Glutamicibacter sp. V16R2B1]|uniref:fatty acid desaturase family protein n=1 Tax=Glutamicibacter sp. V16R2B1 TaxID=2036207 RepID=UPI0010FEC351|nr:acyl-CoA desaturase [Glutamicibacter sp. V16R2B1]TLK55333.1 acyl-CoA desaturase [Glutamicibacter sp. V16R2B1]
MKAEQFNEAYRDLSAAVHEAGLVRRRYRFYWAMLIGWLTTLVLLLAGVFVLGDSWFQLIIAALLGIAAVQFGFLSHEAAHREIFASRAWNEWASRLISALLLGLSYSWWMAKHNSHHANPNKEEADPDVKSNVLALTPDAMAQRNGLAAKTSRYQGWFFIPLLSLEGLNLHVSSVRMLLSVPGVRHRFTELSMITIRHVGLLVLVFAVLSPGKAVAFLGVQVAVFGINLGGAFALNHIGMPIVPADINLDFLRRQVAMSRNITDGPLVRFLMGGLQYQIEHHLFPIVPRPNLPQVQKMVREYCSQLDIPYTERTLTNAGTTVVAYLNQVGLKNRDPYVCPLVQRFRG